MKLNQLREKVHGVNKYKLPGVLCSGVRQDALNSPRNKL